MDILFGQLICNLYIIKAVWKDGLLFSYQLNKRIMYWNKIKWM
jgi:hypothetical protein